MLQQAAVEIDGAGGGDAVKANQNPLAICIFRQGKMFAVPGVIVMKIAVGVILGGIIVLVDDEVMGQIHCDPAVILSIPIDPCAVGAVIVRPGSGAELFAFCIALVIYRPLIGGPCDRKIA